MGFPKRLLGEDEVLVLSLRPHVKTLFQPALVLLVATPIAVMLIGLIPDWGIRAWLGWSVTVVAALIVLRWTVWPFVVWWNTVYAVTTRRLVIREGVFAREGHDMPLTRLNDVSFEHSFWERLLGCGTLMVESAGERGQIVLDDLPRVEQVQRTLYQLSDDARASSHGRAAHPQDDVDPGLRDRDELPDDDLGGKGRGEVGDEGGEGGHGAEDTTSR